MFRLAPTDGLVRPDRKTVETAIRLWWTWAERARGQGYPERAYQNRPDEWDADHRAYIIGMVLPLINPPYRIYRLTVEAYLADLDGKTFEQRCDGSSVVPESKRYGLNLKDWQGVLHDYCFELHHAGDLPDAWGEVHDFWDSNDLYRDAWVADGQAWTGEYRHFVLDLCAWPVWKGWL